MEKLIIYCDGGARGNPGPAASAFVVTRDQKVIYKNYEYLGVATNNQAEYKAVIMALSWLTKNANFFHSEEVVFVLDSQLVAQQLSEIFKVKNENIRSLFLTAKNLEKKVEQKTFYTFVPRSKNKLADFLVNKALDEN